jgi:SAM-dependent methyltransferase
MTDDYRSLVKRLALDESALVQLTLKGKISAALPWRQVTVRPVRIKERRWLQFAHLDARQDVTQNYTADEAAARLDELLTLPFNSVSLRTVDEEISVQLTKKGKAIIHRRLAPARQPTLSHDAAKSQPIPADQPDPFLQATGIMNADGTIKADMRDKFAQINEFLKLFEHTGALENFQHQPLRILDCGCGLAHLTFALYHYLNHLRGIPAELIGVDVNPTVIAKSNARSQTLGLTDVCFYQSAIIDYQPPAPPDIVLALHACDTATDEALAQGIRCGAGLILAAPCCQHHLQAQLTAVPPFAPVLRQGILKQRLGDILTDTFRALLLRIVGYKAEVIEFVAAEHTDRNLMIRAVRAANLDNRQAVREYDALRTFWGVRPYLETLLGDQLMAAMR